MYIHITYKSIRKEESVYDEKIWISKKYEINSYENGTE